MALLDGVAWEGKVFKGGAWTDGRGGTYAVVEPATGNEIGTMGQADAEDVAEAAASAAEAQKEWASLPHTARAAVLRRAGDLWAEHVDEIRDWNVREVGAIPPMADFAMHVAAEECYQAASLPGQPIGQVLPSEQPRLSMARQLPAGVVAVISPFNVPIILGIRSVAPALALGNAVLLKPDPRTAVTGGTVMVRIFEEAGLPAGVLQMLPGGKDVGEPMVTDPHVRVISFTGSTAVGRSIGELAGRHLKRAHLELGGNSALLILDDADIEKAVGLTGWASFLNQGQICMTTG
ncbi:MAG: aldehyde dehydrogenase family protein, partial [Friedmanniella sp.]